MRVQGGIPYGCKDGSIGYIYQLSSKPVQLPPRKPEAPAINARAIIDRWAHETTDLWLQNQANKLGVTSRSLRDLGVCYSNEEQAAAWPMRDGYGNIVGIRLRNDNGSKWAVSGSHQGIFLPSCPPERTAVVCEGPTDTAAALSLGLWAVGRASCSSGLADVPKAFKRLKVTRAIIISDNDTPGLNGAAMLGRQLGIPYCTLVLPCKDLRKFVNSGGTAVMLGDLINDVVWTSPETQ
jgi:hypothetical protein